MPAERSFIAVNKESLRNVSTQAYFIKNKAFNEIMSEFSEFDNFCRTRAIRRRAYLRYLEGELG